MAQVYESQSPLNVMAEISKLKVKTPAVEGWGFVASEGFEPPKAEPADLQSVPFGRLGN